MSDTKSQPAVSELSCDQCRDLLSEYVDREISEAERVAVERHLKTCSKCTTESVRMSGLKNVVRNWDGVKGSGEFRKSLVQQMIRESQQVPSEQFNAAAAKASSARSGGLIEDEDAGKTLPPAWILLVALFLAVAAYFGVMALRGGF
jgi:anti-sigma factor RsiW